MQSLNILTTRCLLLSYLHAVFVLLYQGVWGFILAGFIWFSIPNVMATTTGMAYLALSSDNGTFLLTDDQVLEGKSHVTITDVGFGSELGQIGP